MAAVELEKRNETHFANYAGSIVVYAGHPAIFIADPVQGQVALDSVSERWYIYRGSTNGWYFINTS